MSNSREMELQQELNRRQELESELSKRNSQNTLSQSSSPNMFQFNDGNKSLLDMYPELRDPNQVAKGTVQALGTLGMMAQPEIPALMSGVTMFPKAINALSRIGTQGAFGAMSQPDNPFVGGALGIASTAISPAIKGSFNILKNAFTKVSPEKIGESIQSGHDILKKSAEDIFTDVGKQVVERNISKFPVDKSLISSISDYLPKDRATKKLLNEAASGEYQSLRDLQSDLFHEGTLAKKSDLSTERRSGKEMLDLRNRINESISNHLKNTGNEDLSKLLNEGREKYKKVIDIYYAKKLPNAIKNMVHSESREIPHNIAQLMSKKSIPIDRIHNENPLAMDLVKKAIAHENALKKLKLIGTGTLTLGSIAGLAGLPSLYHKVVE